MGKMPKNMMLNSTIQVGITAKVNAVLQTVAFVKAQSKDMVSSTKSVPENSRAMYQWALEKFWIKSTTSLRKSSIIHLPNTPIPQSIMT